MKRVIAIVGAVGTAAAGFALITPSASARTLNIGDGAATVQWAQCNDGGKSQSANFVNGCSYSYLTSKSPTAPPYTYFSSDGAVTWNNGTIAAGVLTFPADGQTWPKITNLVAGATSTSTPKQITGTIDTATGKVTLNVDFETTLAVGALKCTLTGQTTLTSDGTESLGGQAKGANYDPATGNFAVVSTTPAALSDAGPACAVLKGSYNIPAGMGWYISGQMGLPGGVKPTPPPTPTPTPEPDPTPTPGSKSKLPIKRTGVASSPVSLDADGTTVLTKSIKTNKHGKLTIRGLCRPVGAAAAGEAGGCDVTANAAGKVTVISSVNGPIKVNVLAKATPKAGSKANWKASRWTKAWRVS